MKRTPLSADEHVALGNAVKTLWTLSQNTRCGPYNKTSRAVKAARKLERALVTMKSAFDDEVCALVSDTRDPRHLVTRIYYGPPLVARTPSDPNDDFDGWELLR